jgi:hypothetical protein
VHATGAVSSSDVVHEAVWEWVDRKGLEWCVVTERAKGIRVEGRVVAVLGDKPMKLRYELELDAGWRFLQARLSCESGVTTTDLEMERTAQGWSVDGQQRPDLEGCVDIDIMASPLTNTLPIRRLHWESGYSHDILTSYIRVPELSVERVGQRYSFLGSDSAGGQRFEYLLPAQPTSQSCTNRAFEYHSAASGFRATLQVDAGGLVCHYPPYWRRLR